MEGQLDPYRDWLGADEPGRPLTHYQLLRLAPGEADCARIEEAFERQMGAIAEHFAGPNARLARFVMFELEFARKCLLDADNKWAYDQALRPAPVGSPPPVNRAADAPDAAPGATGSADAPATGGSAPAAREQTATPKWRGTPSDRRGPAVPARSQLAGLLDEAMPKPVVPPPPLNQTALQIPPRREPSLSPRQREALTVALMITLPVIAILAIGFLGTAFLDSRLNTNDSRPPQTHDGMAGDGQIAQRPHPNESLRGDGRTGTPPVVPPAIARSGSDSSGTPARNSSGHLPGRDQEDSSTIQRRPVPASASVAAAVAKIHETYSRDFRQAQTPLDKTSLAAALLSDANNSASEPDYRYALFDLARAVAIDSGDAQLLVRIVDQMAARFEIDSLSLEFAGLAKMFEPEQEAGSRTELIQASVTAADRLRDADRYDEAVKLTQLAFDAGRRLEDPLLTKLLGVRVKELAESQARFLAAQQALALLRYQPDEPAANELAGEWWWLDKHDRDQGFGYLAKAGNYELRSAVVEALAVPKDAERQVKLADAWWDLAHKLAASQKRTATLREALLWYRKAQAQAPGSNSVPTRRIADLEHEVESK